MGSKEVKIAFIADNLTLNVGLGWNLKKGY